MAASATTAVTPSKARFRAGLPRGAGAGGVAGVVPAAGGADREDSSCSTGAASRAFMGSFSENLMSMVVSGARASARRELGARSRRKVVLRGHEITAAEGADQRDLGIEGARLQI